LTAITIKKIVIYIELHSLSPQIYYTLVALCVMKLKYYVDFKKEYLNSD